MFGPVRMTSCRVVPLRSMSLGTNASGRVALDDRMAAVGDDAARRRRARAASCSWRSAAVSASAASTSSVASARAVSWMRGASAATARAQLLEDLQLALEDPLVGAEHLLLVLLQRRRGEPLAAGNRLLPLVVGRDGVQVRLRDLDVVAEHAVEADLQRPMPVRARSRSSISAITCRPERLIVSQIVELGIDAVAREAAVARERPAARR